MLKKIGSLLFFVLMITADAEDFVLTKGWNLLGTSKEIKSMEIFKKNGVNLVWNYDNIQKKWKVYAPNFKGKISFEKIKTSAFKFIFL